MSGSAIGAINEQSGRGAVYTSMNGSDIEQKWSKCRKSSQSLLSFISMSFVQPLRGDREGGWSKSQCVTNMLQFQQKHMAEAPKYILHADKCEQS